MQRALGDVETGELTTATRTVELTGVAIREGQIIGLHNGSLKVAGDDLSETMTRLLAAMDAGDGEIVTLYYGAEITAAQAEQMKAVILAAYSNLEVKIYSGGQPHYHYILSAE